MKTNQKNRSTRVRLTHAASAFLCLFFSSSVVWADLDKLNPGEWYEARASGSNNCDNGSTCLSVLNPCPGNGCSYSGVEGHRAVMDSWSGGAFDTIRNRLIVWGGGHNAYAGNELYAFDLTKTPMAWTRVTEPSTTVSQNALYYPDLKPSARHTYNMLVYAPNVDRFIAVGAGSTYGQSGGSGSAVDAFDFVTNTWSARASIPDAAGYSSYFGSVAAYDAFTGHIWFHNTLSGTLREYDPVANTWQVRVSNYLEDYSTAAVDPVRRLLVTVGGKSGILIWDLNNPTSAPFKPATTSGNAADVALQSAQAPGFVYDSASKLFVGWNGGSAVYTLTPPPNPKTGTWAWSRINPAGSNTVTPTVAEARGTYGRFQYVPGRNVFIAVNRTTENVYFYKFSSGSVTAPTVSLSAAPATTLSPQSVLTLTWASTDAISCTASGAWAGAKPANGTEEITDLTSSGTYMLSCSGAGGSAAQSIAITVDATSDPGAAKASGSGAMLISELLFLSGLGISLRALRRRVV